jgi:hypothetical protein
VIWVTICVWPIGSAALAWFLWKAFPGSDGQTLAAWFQAVGSIAAITVAFLVGRDQSKAALRAVTEQQRERRDSIVAVAGAAAEHARRIRDVLEQEDTGRAMMHNVYDKTIVDGIVNALTSAPAHEVGSPDGVIALLALRDQFVFLGVQMKKYLDGPLELEEFRKLIESCGDDREQRRTTVQVAERVLKQNVRTRLQQIQRFHDELTTAVARLRSR